MKAKTGPRGQEFDPWQLVADLYNAANDHEASVLEDLLLKSGWAWRCEAPGDRREHCGAVVDFDSNTCADCGAERQELK